MIAAEMTTSNMFCLYLNTTFFFEANKKYSRIETLRDNGAKTVTEILNVRLNLSCLSTDSVCTNR